MPTILRFFTLAMLPIFFSGCFSTPAPAPESDPLQQAEETPAVQKEEEAQAQDEEETFMTLFGPMTVPEMVAAAERGDTPTAREQLKRFKEEVELLREAADEVPRLGEGDIAQTALRLDRLVDIDQFVRQLHLFFELDELSEDEAMFLYGAGGDIMVAVDEENTAELQVFFDESGWPKISTYGEEAERNAWLLAQHADQNVEFQKSVLEELVVLLEDEETRPENYAYLFDRVAINTGELQRYGTQGSCAGSGQWEPQAMEEPEELEARRESRGLEPMKDYKARFVTMCP